jgi:hypothetical protein
MSSNPSAPAANSASGSPSGSGSRRSRSSLDDLSSSAAASLSGQRHIQPKLVHDTANQQVTKDSGMEEGPSSANMLYKHALESIFKFLCLHELHRVMLVNRSWLAGVLSMASLELDHYKCMTRSDVLLLCNSRLARHHSAISVGMSANESLNLECFSRLLESTPYLKKLGCALHMSSGQYEYTFSQRLLTMNLLCLYTPSGALTPTSIAEVATNNALLVAIGSCSRLRSLTLFFWYMPRDSAISFVPITRMLSLRELRLLSEQDYSNEQIAQLRSMSQLEVLFFNSSLETLARLLQQPHSLRVQRLETYIQKDDSFVALLPGLPSMTTLKETMKCQNFEFLGGLPNLTSINWDFLHPPPSTALVAGLKLLRSVTHVKLDGAGLNCAQLTEAVSHMPLLQQLCLGKFDELESLAFLSSVCSLASSLTDLQLCDCHIMRLSLKAMCHTYSTSQLFKPSAFTRSSAASWIPFCGTHFLHRCDKCRDSRYLCAEKPTAIG